MAPTLAAVGCEMLRFETGEAVERSPRYTNARATKYSRKLSRRTGLLLARGIFNEGLAVPCNTAHFFAPPRFFFSQTKSCLSGSVHETFPDTIVTNLAGSLSRWIPCGRERCYSSTDPQIGPHTMKFGLGVIKSRSCQIECWQSSRA